MLRFARFTRSYSFKILKENNLDNLISDLKTVMVDVKSKEDVDVRTTMNLLRLYDSSNKEWMKYALRDPSKSYTRNLVTDISPISALLILVWEPGKSSKVHDHPDSNCFVKVLEGTLNENQYSKVIDTIELKRKIEVQPGAVTYINDKIGLHEMENNTKEPVVTLHLYAPQYDKCTTFEKGQESFNSMDYYSIAGEIVKK